MKTTKNKIVKGVEILCNGSFYCAVFIGAGCGLLNYFGTKEEIRKTPWNQSKEKLISSETDQPISGSSQNNLTFTDSTTDGEDSESTDIEDESNPEEGSPGPEEGRIMPTKDAQQKDNSSTQGKSCIERDASAESINTSVLSNQSLSSKKIENRKKNSTIETFIDNRNQTINEKNEVHDRSANNRHNNSIGNVEAKPKQYSSKDVKRKINRIQDIMDWIKSNKKYIKEHYNDKWEDIKKANIEKFLSNLKRLNDQLKKGGARRDIEKDLKLADEYIIFLSNHIKEIKEQKK